MLRIKLWLGFSDIDLRNVSCYKYDIIGDFEELWRELCIIELDLRIFVFVFGIVIGNKK